MAGGAPFTHRVRVRYAEVDAQRVVFNAHWLTYCDDACTRFVESLGYQGADWSEVLDLMLVRAVLEWSGPAGFDEWVDIAVEPVRIGTTSFDLRYRATVDGRPACTAVITYVSVEPGTHAPTPVPARLRDGLAAHAVSPAPSGSPSR
jgi:acyl-CoA thioester hydrolase